MTLPASAAERRRMQHGAHSAPTVIDRHLLPTGAQQQTVGRSPLLQSIDGTDRQTDGQTPDSYTDPRLHTERAASYFLTHLHTAN